jgi:hypothetical protein
MRQKQTEPVSFGFKHLITGRLRYPNGCLFLDICVRKRGSHPKAILVWWSRNLRLKVFRGSNTRKQIRLEISKPINMNNITKMAVVSAAVVLAAQAAQAQIPAGDLVLGFSSTAAGVTQDYIVDLGALPTTASSLGGAVNFSQFGTGGAPSIGNMNVGVLFGKGNASTGDFAGYSVLRTGNNASGVQGTESTPATLATGNVITSAALDAQSMVAGLIPQGNQFSMLTQSSGTAGTFANNMSANPLTSMPGTTISLDLFEATRLAQSGRSTPASAFTYEGTLNIDLTGPNAVVDFVPVAAAVPEPSTYGLIAGAGLLLVSLRRQFRGSTI